MLFRRWPWKVKWEEIPLPPTPAEMRLGRILDRLRRGAKLVMGFPAPPLLAGPRPAGVPLDRRGFLARVSLGAFVAGIALASPSSAALLLRGGNLGELPPPPPGPPFTPPAIPTAVVNLLWNGAGNPTDPGGVTEGAANCWKIQSTVPAFSGVNNHTYSRVYDVYNALAPIADFSLYFPAGNFRTGSGVNGSIVANYAGRNCAFVGAGTWGGTFGDTPDGTPNLWQTVVKPNRIIDETFLWVDDASHTSTISIQNIAISPFYSDIQSNFNVQAGANGGHGLIFKIRCGILCINQCQIARSRANGYASTTDWEWDSMANDIVLIFDTELYGCGANPDQHNIYAHDHLLFRCIHDLSHTSGAHAWKIDGGRAELLDSTVAGALIAMTNPGGAQMGGQASTTNISRDTDIYIRGCAVLSTINNSSPYGIQLSGRRDSLDWISLKYPPFAPKQTAQAKSRTIQWVHGGLNGSVDSGANLVNALNTSSTVITLNNVGPKMQSTVRRNLNDFTAHALIFNVVMDDGSIWVTTGTGTASASGTLTATLDALPSVTAAKGAYVGVRYNSQPIDQMVISVAGGQQGLFDPGYSQYYWDIVAPIDSGTGKRALDFTKQQTTNGGFTTQYVEDTLFAPLTSNRSSATPISKDRTFLCTYVESTSNRQSLPFGSMPSTDASFPTASGAGTFTAAPQANSGTNPAQLFGQNSTINTGINSTDWVRNDMLIMDNIGINDNALGANKYQAQINTSDNDANYRAIPVATNCQWLDSGGTLRLVTDNAKSSPMPASIQFTALAGGSGNSITTTGFVGGVPTVGQRIHIQLRNGSGAFASTVTGVSLSAGVYTISFATPVDPLRPFLTGAKCATFTAAGPKPAGWISPEQFAA